LKFYLYSTGSLKVSIVTEFYFPWNQSRKILYNLLK